MHMSDYVVGIRPAPRIMYPEGFYITLFMTLFSIIGAVIIIASYVICKTERNLIRHLLVSLTIADCCVSVGNFLGSMYSEFERKRNVTHAPYHTDDNVTVTPYDGCYHGSALCKAQSFLTTSSCLVSFAYNLAIAGYFYVAATKTFDTVKTVYVVTIHTVCLLCPLIIVSIAAGLNALGENNNMATTGPWCWITMCKSDHEKIMWMLVTGKGWEFLTYVIAPLLFYVAYYDMKVNRRANSSPFARANARHHNNERIIFREDDKNYIYIPPLFYLTRMYGSIRFIIVAIEVYNETSTGVPRGFVRFLFIMQCFGDNAQAFTNFVLFCILDKKIRGNIWAFLRKRQNEEARPIAPAHTQLYATASQTTSETSSVTNK